MAEIEDLLMAVVSQRHTLTSFGQSEHTDRSSNLNVKVQAQAVVAYTNSLPPVRPTDAELQTPVDAICYATGGSMGSGRGANLHRNESDMFWDELDDLLTG
jgi:hypothetical protein